MAKTSRKTLYHPCIRYICNQAQGIFLEPGKGDNYNSLETFGRQMCLMNNLEHVPDGKIRDEIFQ